MPSYLTPGVYIEEVSGGPRSIEGQGTSTAAFLGIAPKADALVNEAIAVNSFSEFTRRYCTEGCSGTPLAQAVYGFFLNGGRRCYVVNVGVGNSIIGGGRKRQGIDLLLEIDEVAIVAAPGFTDAASYDALLSHCETLKDRVAILDAPADVPDIEALTRAASVEPSKESKRGKSEGEGETSSTGAKPGLRPRDSAGGYGAVYFPHILARDAINPASTIEVAPSGHVAGIYARTDAIRGVHKAPANEVVRGALGVTYRVTHAEQGLLNSQGVNCIRFFDREGTLVWGARTLAPSASEWRYVNVRRLFAMIEESIGRGTRWVVFEPNDPTLWKSIVRDISAFLRLLWSQGALMGATPEQAFFVKCDEETNPPEVVDAGQVVIVVGVAPVKPAEFVIFRISQSVPLVETETEGEEV